MPTEIIYSTYTKKLRPSPWPVDVDGTDSEIWKDISEIADKIEDKLTDEEILVASKSFNPSLISSASVSTTVTRKLKVVKDKRGRKGFWVTLHGHRVFIPISNALKYLGVATAIPLAFSAALMSAPGGRALLKSLVIKGEKYDPFVARRGLLFAISHPRTTYQTVKVAGTLENPKIAYYAVKGFKPDPDLLLVNGFVVSGNVSGIKQSTVSVVMSPQLKDKLYVLSVKARRKKALSGTRVMNHIAKMTKASGKKKVIFQANITEGTYMWARVGADWIDSESTRKAKRVIVRRLKAKFPGLADSVKRGEISPYGLFYAVKKEVGLERAKKVFKNTTWTGLLDFDNPVSKRYLDKLV